MRKRIPILFLRMFLSVNISILIAVCLLLGCAGCVRRQSGLIIKNPYKSVDWVKHGQYKANLHTHTTMGGADAAPHAVIDQYKALGYSILALTDHDNDSLAATTWPWQAFNREPKILGMVAIQGNEISEVHHIGSYFNDYGNPDVQSEEEALDEIGRRGGLAVLNHPGRYEKTVEWYADMVLQNDHLIGLEIYNQTDRYPEDRKMWDAILTALFPVRRVWGVSNDDMHEPEQNLGFSWNVIILPELTSDGVRKALEKGCFFFVHAPSGQDGPLPPIIEAITVNAYSGTIHIQASGHEDIVWVSQGHIVHRGDRLNLVELPDVRKYVRVEVYGAAGSVIGTQPFLIVHPE